VTGKNFDTFNFDFDALMGSAGRVAWKTGNESLDEADTILFAGSDFPFAEKTGLFRGKKFIQIDTDAGKLGKRNPVDVAILGDAGEAIRMLIDLVDEKPESPWYRANLANAKNWRNYVNRLENKSDGPLQSYQVF